MISAYLKDPLHNLLSLSSSAPNLLYMSALILQEKTDNFNAIFGIRRGTGESYIIPQPEGLTVSTSEEDLEDLVKKFSNYDETTDWQQGIDLLKLHWIPAGLEEQNLRYAILAAYIQKTRDEHKEPLKRILEGAKLPVYESYLPSPWFPEQTYKIVFTKIKQAGVHTLTEESCMQLCYRTYLLFLQKKLASAFIKSEENIIRQVLDDDYKKEYKRATTRLQRFKRALMHDVDSMRLSNRLSKTQILEMMKTYLGVCSTNDPYTSEDCAEYFRTLLTIALRQTTGYQPQ